LLGRAHNAIAKALGQPRRDEAPHPALGLPAATFVTLTRHATLRGCMGTLDASRTLDAAVRHHALAAAFRDPRFEPLSAAEWHGLAIEVSLLDAPQPLPPSLDEAEALAQLVPGEHGVVLEWRGRRATFLPQVWEQLAQPREFIGALKRKAGLDARFWAPDVRLACYRVRKFAAPPIGEARP
jgi:AmmeMemoRadiSam system protein A